MSTLMAGSGVSPMPYISTIRRLTSWMLPLSRSWMKMASVTLSKMVRTRSSLAGQRGDGGAQALGLAFHLAAQQQQPPHQRADAEHEHAGQQLDQQVDQLGIDRAGDAAAEPAILDLLALRRGDAGEAVGDQLVERGVALAHRPVQFAGIERVGVAETPLHPALGHVVVGRRVVHAEDPRLLPRRGLDHRLEAGIALEGGDALLGQPFDAEVAVLHPDGEGAQRIDPGDTR